MPYNIGEEAGGDTAPNDQLMEDCVARIRAENPDYTKSRAIAICKASLGFEKRKDKKYKF